MTRLLTTLVLVLLLTAEAVLAADPAPREDNRLRNHAAGEVMPGFTLPLVKGGQKLVFKPGNGRPAALLFFSVTPEFRKKRSLALLAALNDLQERFPGKVTFLAVCSEADNLATVVSYMKEANIRVPVFLDGDHRVTNLYGVFMMPLVVLLDKDGRLHEVIPYTYDVRELVEGNLHLLLGEWDAKKLAAYLAPKLKTPKSKEEKEYIRRVNYGKVMMDRKMYPQAIREFTTATKLLPQRAEAWIRLGFAQLAVKDYNQAETNFRHALALDSEADEAIAGLGLALYNRGALDAALVQLENAFIAPEPRLEVILALADIYEQKGDMQKAIRFNKLAVNRLLTMWSHKWQ